MQIRAYVRSPIFLRLLLLIPLCLLSLQAHAFIEGGELDHLADDTDGDGISNRWETASGLNPNNSDTDGDGYSDQFESDFSVFGWDPLLPTLDSDGDGLPDAVEDLLGTCKIFSLVCPNPADTDGDGFSDFDEVMNLDYGYNPRVANADADFDGLPDAYEIAIATDPYNADTDGDGTNDFLEVRAGVDPRKSGDNVPELVGNTLSAEMLGALADMQAAPPLSRASHFPTSVATQLPNSQIVAPLVVSGKAYPSAALMQSAFYNPTHSPALYKKLADVVAKLQELVKNNSNITRLDKIGVTDGGAVKRDIYAVKISNNPAQNQKDKAEILYMSLHHAREVVSTAIAMQFIETLITKYKAGDKEIKKKVDSSELWIIPVVNPDGYERVLGEQKWDWRKNIKKYPNQNVGNEGVDPNRNYGILHVTQLTTDQKITDELKKLFPNKPAADVAALVKKVKDNLISEKGSSGIKDITVDGNGKITAITLDENNFQSYPGPSPFSEKETQAVKGLVEDKTKVDRFRCSISWHSYGGDIVYPWGFSAQGSDIAAYRKPGDKKRFEDLAKVLKDATKYVVTHPYTYGTFGDSDDWLYGAHGIYAFTIEAYGKNGDPDPLDKVKYNDPRKPTPIEIFNNFNPQKQATLDAVLDRNVKGAVAFADSCLTDFGDAPDKNVPADYPSFLANNGGRHIDFGFEWLGKKVDGEDDADIERDGADTDLDGVDGDRYDDGIAYRSIVEGGKPVFITVTASVLDKNLQTSDGDYRYESSDPLRRLYLNAWADWNGDQDWTSSRCSEVAPRVFDCSAGQEKIIGGGPEKFAINPRTDVEFASGDHGDYDFVIIPPAGIASDFYWRYRLDYGEDVGEVTANDPDLMQTRGPARFGEVEDYFTGKPDQLHLVSPLAGTLRVGGDGTIAASVQRLQVGVAAQAITFTRVLGNFNFTNGLLAQGGKQSTLISDSDGRVNAMLHAYGRGTALVKVTVANSSLAAYAYFVVVP